MVRPRPRLLVSYKAHAKLYEAVARHCACQGLDFKGTAYVTALALVLLISSASLESAAI